jgi:CDP-diacylglycerol pyrophosphatase
MRDTGSSPGRRDARGARGLPWAPLAAVAVLAWTGRTSGSALASPPEPFFDKHPNALWRVVHDLCVPDRRLLGLPAPCLAVNLRGGWAVVKDTSHRTHVLLVPTHRISGIEDPALLAPGAPNYWADAWRARRYFERLAGRPVPRGDIAMMINSRYGRSQDQLHIHIECVAPKVARTLKEAAPHIGAAWTTLDEPLADETFEARRVDGVDLDRNPFTLLAKGDPDARAEMGAYALAAVGAVFPGGQPGFILLAHRADLSRGDRGLGDGLLDHSCRVLRSPIAAGSPPP